MDPIKLQFSLQTKKTDSPCVLGLVADCYGVMVSIISMIMMAAAIPSSGWGSVVRALTLVLRVRVGQQVDPGRYATTHT